MNETKGRRFEALVHGEPMTLCTIGELAAAVGRTPGTVRYWQRQGLIPRAPFMLSSEDVRLRRRLYPPELVDAVRDVAVREHFGRRRPSGRFWRQQEALCAAWRAAMAATTAAGPGG